AAYEVAAVLAEHQLRLGVDAIIDAVSAIEVARRRWRDVAYRTRSKLRIIEVVCSDQGLHRLRLESRQPGIDGFSEPTWEHVLARRTEFVPWREERLVLDTIEDLSVTLPKALTFLRPTEE
ncbi:MAG: AAA family ATPase, partial [Candidatus Nanopelagicales bacterium]